jgi:multiple sugar transport system substrate-binding protein
MRMLRGARGAGQTRLTRRMALAGGSSGLAAVLAACAGPGAGGPAGGGAEGQPATSKEPVVLRWSTWGDGQNPFNTTAAPMGLELFNKKFPNVQVQVEVQLTGWDVKNASEWIAGTGPDLSGHCCQTGPVYARQGFLLNLDPYIKKDAKQVPTADYVEWLMKLFSAPQLGQFALPMYTGTIGLMFNRNLFKQKGVALPDENWDWNTYRDAGVKLATPDQSVWARADVGAGSMYRRFHQNGANMVDPQDDTKAAFNSDKAIAALSYERDTIQKDRSTVIIAGPKQAPATVGLDHYQQINAGKIAMWEGGSFTLTRYMTMLGPEVDWDVAPLPKGPAGRFTLATNDGWSIWSGTKSKDAAWELLKFLQSDEWTDVATKVVGQQSARKSFQQRWLAGIKEANPKMADKNLKPFAEAVEKNYARPLELFRKQVEANTEFVNAYNKSVRDGDEEVATSMKAAAELVNQINKS